MTHTYQISGMTCSNCEAKVKSAFLSLHGIESAEVSHASGIATLTMTNHIAFHDLQTAIRKAGNYNLLAEPHHEAAMEAQSWLATYRPILLIFAYLMVVTLLVQVGQNYFDLMQWMRHFMAGFFLVFSFFKILKLSEFADSYAHYDIIAVRFRSWGYIYAFMELGLGLAFLLNFNAVMTNLVTLLVMSVSIIGVIRSVMNKRRIQCACLGAVFNLPMSTVTIIEDGLMIAMSAFMVFMLL